jgi:predicted RNase H-like HicB family nuclease
MAPFRLRVVREGGNFRTGGKPDACWGVEIPCGGRAAEPQREDRMRTFTATVERDPDTGIYVGYVPGVPGAHSQGDTLDELETNLREVLELLAEPQAEPFGVLLTPLEW